MIDQNKRNQIITDKRSGQKYIANCPLPTHPSVKDTVNLWCATNIDGTGVFYACRYVRLNNAVDWFVAPTINDIAAVIAECSNNDLKSAHATLAQKKTAILNTQQKTK